MLFTSVHILDSMYKCHYNVFMLQLMCQQFLTVHLYKKSDSSKCNLSMSQHYDCKLKHSRITAFYVSLVTKGYLESPCVFFGKRLDTNLDKCV